MPLPQALLFDVFGTLVDWRTGVTAALRGFAERGGLTRGDWEGFVDAWRDAYSPSLDRVRRGDIGWRNLDALQRESLVALLERAGARPDDDECARLVRAWHALPAWPDVVAGLRRLRARFVTASLSNGHVALQIALCRHADLSFDMLFSAELFRHYKPDTQTYLGACALLDLPPERVMLVAAHADDLRAAKACGLQTAFVSRPLERGTPPAHAANTGEFDRWADGLDDLAQQLGA